MMANKHLTNRQAKEIYYAWLKENVLDKYMYGDESGDESSPDAVKISVSR